MFSNTFSPKKRSASSAPPQCHTTGLARQRGISLVTVLVILLLTLLLTFISLRVANFNEAIVGNQAEEQRTFSRAEALVAAAQAYIVAQGPRCAASCALPTDVNAFNAIHANAATHNKCSSGICYPDSPDNADFAVDQIGKTGKPMQPAGDDKNGLSYTEFASGAVLGGASGTASSTGSANSTYWIEVFYYSPPDGANPATDQSRVSISLPIPENTVGRADAWPFIYRITARAEGLRNSSQTVLRTYYVPVEKPVQRRN